MQLYEYELRTSNDIAKTDLELIHVTCGHILCDAEASDTLETLVNMATHHAPRCTVTGYRAPKKEK